MVTKPAACSYEFGSFRLDVAKRLLLRNGEIVALTPKCLDILLVLVESGGALLSKDELMQRVWPDSFVEESNLTYNISTLRKALGEKAADHHYIVTVPGHGYRFVAAVKEVSEQPAELTASTPAKLLPVQRKIKGKVVVAAGVLVLFSSILIYWAARKPTATMESPSPVKSIAVLPFELVGAEPNSEAEYLSDGISESLINQLSQLKGVKVIARSSSFKYKGKEVDTEAAARALGVEYLLSGRVWPHSEQIQIGVELMDMHDKTQIWGEQYNRQATDLLRVEAEISREIVRQLRLKLTTAEQQQLAKRETVNPQAYELWLKGDFYTSKDGAANRLKGIEYFNQAINVDPNYAHAYASLSMSYGYFGLKAKAREMAEKALLLDENLAEGHLAIANLYTGDWNWAAAEAKYQYAIELNPNLVRARSDYCYYLSNLGRFEQALVEIEIARKLDPLNLQTYISTGNILLLARRYDEAMNVFKQTLELDNSFLRAHNFLGFTYAAKGMHREAISEYQESIRLGDTSTNMQIYLGAAYAKIGEREKAQAILKRLQTSKELVSPCEIAILYSSLGKREEAFASLERAYAVHDDIMMFIGVDPAFDPLRSDPRYQDLLRRVGLPQ